MPSIKLTNYCRFKFQKGKRFWYQKINAVPIVIMVGRCDYNFPLTQFIKYDGRSLVFCDMIEVL